MRTWTSLGIAAIAAVFVVACSEGGGTSSSPTGPSTTPGTSTTPPPQPPPQQGCVRTAPTNLAASIKGTAVVLTWSAVSGATEYVVMIGTTPSSSNIVLTNTGTASASYGSGSLTPGTYYARVQATYSCGSSSASNEVVFTISQPIT